jgi:hypothetical protein
MEVWIALALSLVIATLFIRARANRILMPKLVRGAPITSAAKASETQPDCMAVIPARNEAGFIGRTVRSLPPDSVIVVDDHSEDTTGEEARQAGAGVILAPKLSRGAYGKSNACMAGARALKSRWILFTDADAHFEPGFADAVVACAEASGVALLSVYLDPEYATTWERIISPYLNALFFCGANPRSDAPTACNGQCVLVRREAYEFLGGHAAVINDLIEDVRLAAVAQRHRLKFGIVRADGLGKVRWRDLGGMVERGASRFMIAAPMQGTTILIAALATAAWLPTLVWLLADSQYRAAVAFAVLPYLLLWRWYADGSGRLAALFIPFAIPLASWAALPMLGRGLWGALSGGASEWKGRSG